MPCRTCRHLGPMSTMMSMIASLVRPALASGWGLTPWHGKAGLRRSPPSVEAPERSLASASTQVQVVLYYARASSLAGCTAEHSPAASFDAAACCAILTLQSYERRGLQHSLSDFAGGWVASHTASATGEQLSTPLVQSCECLRLC